ncbi:MAG: ABC transporter ATP-binding protein [bacterium]
MQTLEIQSLRKSFGTKEVLKGFSFTASAGSAFGLLGRNGAGKTTTLRILMGVFPADGGQVLVDGAPIDRKKTTFGYLPEERGLYPKLKILDQLTYFAMLHGMTKANALSACKKWLMRLEMWEEREKKPEMLSKGNQQKIQLVTALAHDPAIVVLDEPFSGLDPVNARLLKDVVREEQARGKLILFSSHQMAAVEEFCDDIVLLHGGEAALAGSLRELKRAEAPDTLLVRTGEAERLLREWGSRARLTESGEAAVSLRGEARGAVMEKLVRSYDCESVRLMEPSLEDLFVKYAGGGAA